VSRNLVRVAILVWLGISVYTGLSEWTHHDVPVVVQVPATEANLSGQATVMADYTCPAVIGGSGAPEINGDLADVVGPADEPCEPYVRGRQLLFWIDVVVGLAALALTFAHLPRRFRERRGAAETVSGQPVNASAPVNIR
jgi:hypothetical protein